MEGSDICEVPEEQHADDFLTAGRKHNISG